MTEQSTKLPKEHISLKTLVNYSSGSFANNMLNGFVFANITFFYNQKLGADPYLLGIAWLIFAIWNTLNDPIASYMIDNTRTKIGRRIPYIRYGSIFYGLAFIFCWFPISPLGNQVFLFFNFLLALFLLDTMFTIVGVCFFSLPNEIALTAEGRAKIGIFGVLFGFFSTALTLLLPIMLLTNQSGINPIFGPTMVFIGLGCAAILFISSYGIKENMFAQLQPHEGFFEGLKLTLKNKPFWIFMIPAFCMALIMPVVQTGVLYYIDYIIQGQPFEVILISLVLGLVIGIGVNLYNISKLGAKKTIMISIIILIVGLITLFFLGSNVMSAAMPFGLLAFGLAGALVSLPVILGDTIDNDELITGRRREAVYGGVNAIVTKPAISIANWLFLYLIKVFGFVDPLFINDQSVKQPQDELALIGILFAICIIPAIGLAVSVFVIHWYPLDGSEWQEKKRYIMELHKKKEQEYVQKLAEEGKLRTKEKKTS